MPLHQGISFVSDDTDDTDDDLPITSGSHPMQMSGSGRKADVDRDSLADRLQPRPDSSDGEVCL